MKETYDPDVLRTAGGRLSSQSQAVAAALQRLKSSLPDTAAMCGGDDAGQQFSAKYKPAADRLQQFLGDMAGGLDGGGQGLCSMATTVEQADASSTVPGG
jgi:uncharacterized protein YukE